MSRSVVRLAASIAIVAHRRQLTRNQPTLMLALTALLRVTVKLSPAASGAAAAT